MSVIVKKTIKQTITDNIDENRDKYIQTSHQIHENPEIGNKEYFASQLLMEILHAAGFEIKKGVAAHDTAFVARKKSNKRGRSVAFLAEYDALPKLGHACGHNMIGTISVAAATALSKVIDEVGGEIVVFGTPAKEGGPNGSSKGCFIREGLLNDIDAAIILHPSNETRLTWPTLAVNTLDIEFSSEFSEQDINALDGVIQLFNGINTLREHLPKNVTINGIITDGGDTPNTVPQYAKARFLIRAETKNVLDEVTKKVRSIAKGASLITGAQVIISNSQNQVDHFILNERFDKVFKDVIENLGETVYSEEKKALFSTDTGNISQVVPTIHPTIKIGSSDLVSHTAEFREAAKSEKSDQAIILGAKALALTMLEILSNDKVYEEIKLEFLDKKK